MIVRFLHSTYSNINLYQFEKDSVNLEEAIKTPDREKPFILKHGLSYHIIADRKPYMFVTGGSMEALLCLVSTYFVFHLQYATEVLPSLLFTQSQLLEMEDDETKKSSALKLFAQKLRELSPTSA